MKASQNPIVGRWRIVEADIWDRDYLDLCGPASLMVRANGDGEIAFGAMQASLEIDYGPDEIGFTWAGFDEMTEVSGAGSAELQDDGSLQIEFDYHLGDEAVLRAVRGTLLLHPGSGLTSSDDSGLGFPPLSRCLGDAPGNCH